MKKAFWRPIKPFKKMTSSPTPRFTFKGGEDCPILCDSVHLWEGIEQTL